MYLMINLIILYREQNTVSFSSGKLKHFGVCNMCKTFKLNTYGIYTWCSNTHILVHVVQSCIAHTLQHRIRMHKHLHSIKPCILMVRTLSSGYLPNRSGCTAKKNGLRAVAVSVELRCLNVWPRFAGFRKAYSRSLLEERIAELDTNMLKSQTYKQQGIYLFFNY